MHRVKAKAHHVRKNTSKKLLINLRIFAVVYLILFCITIYMIIVSHAIFWQILVAILIGATAGAVSSRMYKISWDEHKAEVVGRIDLYGVIVLILFIVFELNRNFVAGLFTTPKYFGVISFVLLTSALFGRIIGTLKQIWRTLKRQGIHLS